MVFSLTYKPSGQDVRRFFCAQSFARWTHIFLAAYCLSAALTIGFSQVAVLLTIAAWLGFELLQAGEVTVPPCSRTAWRIAVPTATWCAAGLFASACGLNTGKALVELFKTSIYLLLPFAAARSMQVAAATSDKRVSDRAILYVALLLVSMCAAGVHTVVSAAFGFEIRPRIPGPVTESGQLVLVIPLLFALCLLQADSAGKGRVERPAARNNRLLPAALLFFVLLLFTAWPQAFLARSYEAAALYLQLGGAAAAAALTAAVLVKISGAPAAFYKPGSRTCGLFLTLAGPLLIAVLIVNLKRGPWMGVIAALSLFGWLFSRRLFGFTLLAAVLGFACLEPARSRLLSFVNDFVIFGGRASMWSLGFELLSRYPLGIGLDNASFMREMDPSLPYLHRHMHNNLLNVGVETGFLGLAVYIWWMATTIGLGLSGWAEQGSRKRRMLLAAVSCALLGWQVAGLVEYNFGDGEVRMIAFFLIGLLIALSDEQRHSAPPQ